MAKLPTVGNFIWPELGYNVPIAMHYPDDAASPAP